MNLGERGGGCIRNWFTGLRREGGRGGRSADGRKIVEMDDKVKGR